MSTDRTRAIKVVIDIDVHEMQHVTNTAVSTAIRGAAPEVT